MKRIALLGAVFTAVLVLVLPFVGGGGPSFLSPAYAAETTADRPVGATTPVATTPKHATHVEIAAAITGVQVPAAPAGVIAVEAAAAPATPAVDTEHIAQKPVPKPQPPLSAADRASGTAARRAALAEKGLSCPGPVGGGVPGAPGHVWGQVAGTTTADLQSFAQTYNAIRVANCLNPVPMSHFRYDSCMEARLRWMAEDPSTDPMSAWGHTGVQRSDGVPIVGCDGNLAGGSGNTGATVAQKWWNSTAHRNSLYRPTYTGSTAGVCIYFAMTHGGIPNEPYSFTRAAARWGSC